MVKKRSIYKWRMLVLTGAFLVILINPFLNRFFHFNFVQGWYQSLGIGKLWFVSPLEGIESILVAKLIYLPLLIGMLIPILLALFLGRVFCSWLCPISFLSEVSDWIRSRLSSRPFIKDRLALNRRTLWFALIGEVTLAMILGAPIFVFLSPPGLVGREIMMAVFFRTMALEGVVVLAVLAMNLMTRRFFCRYLCPLGALLAFIGSARRLKVTIVDPTACTKCGLCDRACLMGISPRKRESMGIYCWNCGECVDACPKGALDYRWAPPKEVKEPKVGPAVMKAGPPLKE